MVFKKLYHNLRYLSTSHFEITIILPEVMYMRLKELREDNDLKQTEIAKLLNVNQNTYSQYENGKRQIPISSLIALAEFYNTSVDYILNLTDNRTPYERKLP